MAVTKLVLVRHGESEWNKENRFTGWADIGLSEKGRSEAKQAGDVLKKEGLIFDFAYTSVLQRAIHTLDYVLDVLGQSWLPVEKSWMLNERHYGALQGLDKAETAKKYGDDQVKLWRRGFAISPPELTKEDQRFPGHDPRYVKLSADQLPLAESLATTVERVIPYWDEVIQPRIARGERVIIVAHGNSLRALIKYLYDMTEDEILELNIPTAAPLVYELNEDFKPIKHYYLGNAEEIAAKAAVVANQGKAK
ncbi:2,3-diphosphoglycerate-dependent phosphoglycerate mutase [Candidatus Fukatsuia symbiotica]|uniref:2,3-bisphosphoglycerate-dependent phosphoglycerate mutase n=1 Tax=Candidatus Fukatsuia symbiotica TaxID=1878942 RepID=A0A2U8I6A9_9GAMM|nr:2,3-diphosphoglycerate-dependent phosphoglycerate mutase [Candidatus Fukatsuia symbiotica]AWK14682.1 phosphoglyceromutase [Candidatus Fukatsuia symbiotica]MEA9445005.1 2,3-diphosphoglycerate-dependent phosphoglycerate mutase [Candidatus Fukatsuia symbiotica]